MQFSLLCLANWKSDVVETVVSVEDVVTRFGDKLVHDNISLEVSRGDIYAIVGGSGSGKSTLMREMALLERPQSGTIRLFGKDTAALEEQEVFELRHHIGVMFQGGALFTDLTVAENVAFPLREHTKLSERTIRELAGIRIRLSGLEPSAGSLYPGQLSGGMRKRAALARALALDPELLFLDEPGSGLDPVSADALDQLILRLRDSLGLTMVIITHDIPSVWAVADHVALLGDARILAFGTVEELAGSADPAVHRFFRGPRGERETP